MIESANQILGLESTNKSIANVKRAFKQLSLRNHPDKCRNDPTANDRYIQILKAYQYLMQFLPPEDSPGIHYTVEMITLSCKLKSIFCFQGKLKWML